MKKRSIILITVSMAVALLGVMAMQFYFLRQSYQLQSELFDGLVKEALNNVVTQINKHDQINFLNNKANNKVRYQTRFVESKKPVILKDYKSKDYTYSIPPPPKTPDNTTDSDMHPASIRIVMRGNKLNKEKIAKLKDSLNQLIAMRNFDRDIDEVGLQMHIEEFTNEFGQVQRTVTPMLVPLQTPHNPHKINKYDTISIVYADPMLGKQVVFERRINPLWQREQDRKAKEQQLVRLKHLLQVEKGEDPARSAKPRSEIFEKLATEYQRTDEPLQQRLNQAFIDSLLRFELSTRNISLKDFTYEVTTAHNDSLIFAKAQNADDSPPVFLASNTYKMPIFSEGIIKDPGQIRVSFPHKNSLILSHMAATMATTGGLLMVLIFCFGFTIYAIIRQKKISEMKTDFINNMTHEFKTPVSTIMIASEALRDDEIAQDKKRVSKLANIIYEENVRLGSHIERVLNIARIEKDDFKLDIKTIDVNETITTVLDSMLLKLQKHDVKVEMELSEIPLMIKADELHFSNVIYNLIDNAIKYSTEAPEITITTALGRNNQAIIKIADKGIGMSYDQQAKIFEQFYRIPTGNLHDVKGFGLGLSYVNTIVKRLNGSISVRSEKDKGSEFELRFDKVSA
jgi:two-component system, OmpR family, phosphate regulon sensor histidine kinase PhoR